MTLLGYVNVLRSLDAWRLIFALAFFAALTPSPGLTQEEAEDEPQRGPAIRIVEIEQRLAVLRQQLEERDATSEESADAAPGVSPEERETVLLERLHAVLRDRKQAAERRATLDEERRQLDEDPNPAAIPDHGPPYSIAEHDDLLDRLVALEKSRRSLEEAIDGQSEILELARERSQRQEREERAAEEALAQAEPDAAVGLGDELRLQGLAAELAREEAALLAQQLDNDRFELTSRQDREETLRAAAVRIRQQLRPSDEDRRSVRDQFDNKARDLGRHVADVRQELQQAEDRWMRAQGNATPVTRLDARRMAVTAARQRLKVAEDALARLDLRREAWEIRFRLWRGELGHQDLEEARATLSDLAGRLERDQRRRESLLHQSQATLVDLGSRLAEMERSDRSRRAIEEQQTLTRELTELYHQDLRDLERARSRVERPLERMDEQLADVGFGERLEKWKEVLLEVWAYELVVAQGSSITVRKVVTAIFLMLVGLWSSRRLSQLLGRRILHRFWDEESVVATLQTLTFYLLLLAFFLWALHTVNIPLTVFTFLGGALAIGVGFGSQNIVKNFMSGLILMAERPVKVGDLIELEDASGRVERIGARSTRIRGGDNTHVIVPNSTLLEGRVLNWTVSDNVVRTMVDVGVAYGSDPEQVKDRLEWAFANCTRVLAKPAPEVLFVDFGADALVFRTLFWTRVHNPLDRERAQSQARFEIDRLMREADITIAFPQRDVHLDTTRPLDVRIVVPSDREY